jgi:hypothetical protein
MNVMEQMKAPEWCEVLPNGRLWHAPVAAHRAVWSQWFRLAAYAVQHGMGVTILFTPEGLLMETVNAEPGKKHCFAISEDGEIMDCSEPYAEPLGD